MENTLKSQIKPELMFLNYEASDKLALLEQMSDWLFEHGYVKEGFKHSIIEREKVYPTGLKLDSIQFAIPHTDADMVINPGVVFIQLKDRVEFTEMATFDSKVNAKVIFMLLLHKDGSQVELLQDIIARCTAEGFISSLEEAKSPEEVLAIIGNE
ncbi:MAG: PTS sugar transporter subunit IIA [Erysipelotrichaceae bacterium]|nr:PTS sugar transporter subunit IIA [Erysipelotrichaceae bacterium]